MSNLCLWCDAPCDPDVLCPGCRAINDHPLFYCKVDPTHIPTLGPSCATCDYEAERRARVARENAPAIASLRAIRAQHIRDWNRPWRGMEFAKALFGMMIDRSLKDLGADP